jgi:DNA-dependent RNA polymerase auxiliary subunit epsilon
VTEDDLNSIRKYRKRLLFLKNIFAMAHSRINVGNTVPINIEHIKKINDEILAYEKNLRFIEFLVKKGIIIL